MSPIAGTQIITNQIKDLLSKIDSDTYTQSLPTFNGSSVGQHVRHIIDFYLCLIRGCEGETVDYDNRQRNPLIETDPRVAIEELKGIAEAVQKMNVHHVLTVNSSFSTDEDEGNSQVPSSVGRELMYAYDHAIHHLAMVKIGMTLNFPEVEVDKNLGVAPSTIKYRKEQVKSIAG